MRKFVCFIVSFGQSFIKCPPVILKQRPKMNVQSGCVCQVGFLMGVAVHIAAFKHRLKKRKPPLPSFSSCAIDGGWALSIGERNLRAM